MSQVRKMLLELAEQQEDYLSLELAEQQEDYLSQELNDLIASGALVVVRTQPVITETRQADGKSKYAVSQGIRLELREKEEMERLQKELEAAYKKLDEYIDKNNKLHVAIEYLGSRIQRPEGKLVGRCEICEHWEGEKHKEKYMQHYNNYGDCKLMEDGVDLKDNKNLDKASPWDYEGYSAGMYIGKNFCCKHFRRKND